jgi:HSP20 family protein
MIVEFLASNARALSSLAPALSAPICGSRSAALAVKAQREGSSMANDPHEWMWSEALSMLARAERMHQQMFQPALRRTAITWEPPVDVLETEHEVLVLAALPGVDVSQVNAAIEGATLKISGQRVLPPQLRTATIHRLELPQGRFERLIPLPAGRYESVSRAAVDGCLLISLKKAVKA